MSQPATYRDHLRDYEEAKKTAETGISREKRERLGALAARVRELEGRIQNSERSIDSDISSISRPESSRGESESFRSAPGPLDGDSGSAPRLAGRRSEGEPARAGRTSAAASTGPPPLSTPTRTSETFRAVSQATRIHLDTMEADVDALEKLVGAGGLGGGQEAVGGSAEAGRANGSNVSAFPRSSALSQASTLSRASRQSQSSAFSQGVSREGPEAQSTASTYPTSPSQRDLEEALTDDEQPLCPARQAVFYLRSLRLLLPGKAAFKRLQRSVDKAVALRLSLSAEGSASQSFLAEITRADLAAALRLGRVGASTCVLPGGDGGAAAPQEAPRPGHPAGDSGLSGLSAGPYSGPVPWTASGYAIDDVSASAQIILTVPLDAAAVIPYSEGAGVQLNISGSLDILRLPGEAPSGSGKQTPGEPEKVTLAATLSFQDLLRDPFSKVVRYNGSYLTSSEHLLYGDSAELLYDSSSALLSATAELSGVVGRRALKAESFVTASDLRMQGGMLELYPLGAEVRAYAVRDQPAAVKFCKRLQKAAELSSRVLGSSFVLQQYKAGLTAAGDASVWTHGDPEFVSRLRNARRFIADAGAILDTETGEYMIERRPNGAATSSRGAQNSQAPRGTVELVVPRAAAHAQTSSQPAESGESVTLFLSRFEGRAFPPEFTDAALTIRLGTRSRELGTVPLAGGHCLWPTTLVNFPVDPHSVLPYVEVSVSLSGRTEGESSAAMLHTVVSLERLLVQSAVEVWADLSGPLIPPDLSPAVFLRAACLPTLQCLSDKGERSLSAMTAGGKVVGPAEVRAGIGSSGASASPPRQVTTTPSPHTSEQNISHVAISSIAGKAEQIAAIASAANALISAQLNSLSMLPGTAASQLQGENLVGTAHPPDAATTTAVDRSRAEQAASPPSKRVEPPTLSSTKPPGSLGPPEPSTDVEALQALMNRRGVGRTPARPGTSSSSFSDAEPDLKRDFERLDEIARGKARRSSRPTGGSSASVRHIAASDSPSSSDSSTSSNADSPLAKPTSTGIRHISRPSHRITRSPKPSEHSGSSDGSDVSSDSSDSSRGEAWLERQARKIFSKGVEDSSSD